MKFKEVKDLSAQDLTKKLSSLKTELFEARMKNTLGQNGNPLVIRTLRRNIARVKTALTSVLTK